ncbi:MAG: hypothetical protein GY788_16415 [bacterium]|nr:hypothetical protein [bacterium]
MPKPKPKRGQRPGSAPATPARYTDLGNARLLVARHGHELRYSHDLRSWLAWDGQRWRKDSTGEIQRRAKETALAIQRGALDIEDHDRRKKRVEWGLKTESAYLLRTMVDLATTEPGIPITVEALDAGPALMTVNNGTLDLDTCELRAHDPKDLITKLAEVEYDPDPVSPIWEQTLLRIFDGVTAMVEYFQRVCGYCLRGDNQEQVMFVLWGSGANGKSTVIETLRCVLGEYAQQAPADALLKKRGQGGPSPELARMRGARLVVTNETEGGRALSEVTVKQLTGGDTVTARQLYKEYVEFRPDATFFLVTNHLPKVSDTDEGIWRRLQVVPFAVTIPKAEQDGTLHAKLLEERAGIFAWMVEGLREWHRQGLNPPPQVTQASGDYRDSMDVVGAFLDECCVEDPDAKVGSTQLYEAFKKWAEDSGNESLAQKDFSERLVEREYEKRNYGKEQLRTWFGLALSEPEGESQQSQKPETS